MLPDKLKKVVENFKKFPGIGEKTAERLTFSLLDFSKEQLTSFSDSLLEVRDNIFCCSICGNISDNAICSICSDSSRDSEVILVVEKAKDILLFEKSATFKGKYHVLGGLISPLDGIGPNDINLANLISRIHSEKIKEIVFALKSNIEAETTIQYIKKILCDTEIKISKLAIGVPIGADMEYIDSLTLGLAIDERKNIS